MSPVDYKKVNGCLYPVRRACSLIRLLIGSCVFVRSISLCPFMFRVLFCIFVSLLLYLLLHSILSLALGSNKRKSYPVVLFQWIFARGSHLQMSNFDWFICLFVAVLYIWYITLKSIHIIFIGSSMFNFIFLSYSFDFLISMLWYWVWCAVCAQWSKQSFHRLATRVQPILIFTILYSVSSLHLSRLSLLFYHFMDYL